MEFELPIRGPFALAELATFGFGPATPPGPAGFDGVMRLACCADGSYEPVGVEVRQRGDLLACLASGAADASVVARQVARVLSVDHDGRVFAEVGTRDPVIGKLQAAAPGLRPPQFCSPYEAAVWSLLSARRSRAQAALVWRRLAEAHGTTFDLASQRVAAFPSPHALLALDSFPGVPADRIPRLHAVARAALDGRLDVAHLAALDPADARAELQRLPGIGPFYSGLIVIRACGLADVLPTDEPMLRGLIPRLYDLPDPVSPADLEALAEPWRPFRTWAAVLIRAVAPRVLDGT